MKNAIQEKENTIQEKENTIQEKENTIQEKENTIQEKEKAIKTLENTLIDTQEKDALIKENKLLNYVIERQNVIINKYLKFSFKIIKSSTIQEVEQLFEKNRSKQDVNPENLTNFEDMVEYVVQFKKEFSLDQTTHETLKTEMEKCKNTLVDKELQINELQKKLKTKNDEYVTLKHEKENFEKTIAVNNQQIQKLRDDNEKLTDENNKHLHEIETHKAQVQQKEPCVEMIDCSKTEDVNRNLKIFAIHLGKKYFEKFFQMHFTEIHAMSLTNEWGRFLNEISEIYKNIKSWETEDWAYGVLITMLKLIEDHQQEFILRTFTSKDFIDDWNIEHPQGNIEILQFIRNMMTEIDNYAQILVVNMKSNMEHYEHVKHTLSKLNIWNTLVFDTFFQGIINLSNYMDIEVNQLPASTLVLITEIKKLGFVKKNVKEEPPAKIAMSPYITFTNKLFDISKKTNILPIDLPGYFENLITFENQINLIEEAPSRVTNTKWYKRSFKPSFKQYKKAFKPYHSSSGESTSVTTSTDSSPGPSTKLPGKKRRSDDFTIVTLNRNLIDVYETEFPKEKISDILIQTQNKFQDLKKYSSQILVWAKLLGISFDRKLNPKIIDNLDKSIYNLSQAETYYRERYPKGILLQFIQEMHPLRTGVIETFNIPENINVENEVFDNLKHVPQAMKTINMIYEKKESISEYEPLRNKLEWINENFNKKYMSQSNVFELPTNVWLE